MLPELILCLSLSGCKEPRPVSEPLPFLLDERDMRTYPTVRIGNKIWMSKDLAHPSNYTPSSNIYLVKTLKNQSLTLYEQWDDACFVCPDGWHLSTPADWEDLETALGFPHDQLNASEEERAQIEAKCKIGERLKKTGEWGDENLSNAATVGFDALGYVNVFSNKDNDIMSTYWTSSPQIIYTLTLGNSALQRKYPGRPFGKWNLVRCVKNAPPLTDCTPNSLH